MSLVHRRLYRVDQIEVLDAARYIEDLCADTVTFMGQNWAKHLTLNLLPVMVPTSKAVTLGLLLTELMINANKYAYGGGAGPLDVELTETTTHLVLVVADRGYGIPAQPDEKVPSKGLGSRIMAGLLLQIGAKLTRSDNNPGLRTEISVPL